MSEQFFHSVSQWERKYTRQIFSNEAINLKKNNYIWGKERPEKQNMSSLKVIKIKDILLQSLWFQYRIYIIKAAAAAKATAATDPEPETLRRWAWLLGLTTGESAGPSLMEAGSESRWGSWRREKRWAQAFAKDASCRGSGWGQVVKRCRGSGWGHVVERCRGHGCLSHARGDKLQPR